MKDFNGECGCNACARSPSAGGTMPLQDWVGLQTTDTLERLVINLLYGWVMEGLNTDFKGFTVPQRIAIYQDEIEKRKAVGEEE